MDGTLRILIVEDSESDTELIVRSLERAGFTQVHERVETAPEIRVALQRSDWDIIIGDYTMPRFDAFAALRILQESGRDIPFIVVSDTLGEENAVAMMKAGAHDYVMKGNLARLVPAVERELRETEGRRQRKFAEEALRQSEERYRALYEDNPSMYFTVDAEGIVLSVNRFGAEELGYTVEELVGQPVLTVFHRDDKEEVRRQFARCLRNPMQVAHWEFRKVRKDRSILWVKEAARAVPRADGKPVVLVVCEDITQQKLAEESLRQSEEKYRTILETMDDSYVETDIAGNLTFFNPSACKLLGYSADELKGMNYRKLMNEPTAKEVRRIFQSIYQTGKGASAFEYTLIQKDGTKTYVETSVSLMKDSQGQPIGFRGVGRDISERKRAETDRLKERERLATVLDVNPLPAFMIDEDHRTVFWNRAVEALTAIPREDALGKTLSESLSPTYMGKSPPILADLILDMTDTDLLQHYGHKIRRARVGEAFEVTAPIWPGGKKRILELVATRIRDHQGAVLGAIQCAHDVTDKVHLQKQLQHAQKMEAVGTLAGGIAHDFNNILTAVMGFTEMALSKISAGSPARPDLERVLDAGARARDVVRQILTFSRPTELEQKPILVTPLVKEALKLLRSSLPTTIDIQQDIAVSPEEGVLLGDPTEIHQVLMNLCTNAAHAMRAKGGVLRVELAGAVADASLVSRYPDLRPGPYVRLTVSDTGHGIDATVMERIFDPYFTTKEPGEGTGLGLAVVQGIVKGYGGAITVHSKPGKGATFHVFLPRIEEVIVPQAEPVEVPATGNERILFVDDEKALVDLGKRMLESLGYLVDAKTNSVDALDVFSAGPDAFDLVITDMTMPNLTGMELAKKVMAIRPDIPIILCTGFRDLADGKESKAIGVREVLMKPYVTSDLAKAIRKVLDET